MYLTAWRKSSFSSVPDGNCVEVAIGHEAVAVRDSKNVEGPTLGFGYGAWRGLVAGESAPIRRR